MPSRWRPKRVPSPPDDLGPERVEHQRVLTDAFEAMVLAARALADATRTG